MTKKTLTLLSIGVLVGLSIAGVVALLMGADSTWGAGGGAAGFLIENLRRRVLQLSAEARRKLEEDSKAQQAEEERRTQVDEKIEKIEKRAAEDAPIDWNNTDAADAPNLEV